MSRMLMQTMGKKGRLLYTGTDMMRILRDLGFNSKFEGRLCNSSPSEFDIETCIHTYPLLEGVYIVIENPDPTGYILPTWDASEGLDLPAFMEWWQEQSIEIKKVRRAEEELGPDW